MESDKPALRNSKLTADVLKQAYLYLKGYACYRPY